VAYFKSTIIQADEVNAGDVSAWKLNDQPVLAINKFVTEAAGDQICPAHKLYYAV